ncbi:hypothetical protein B0H10DRAFT_895235 [Mycena sp. CBHHK59/15]|nr:hypothetical protein B0H10DRAFT_895235 [Mycena sp. CBHHK59/15]
MWEIRGVTCPWVSHLPSVLAHGRGAHLLLCHGRAWKIDWPVGSLAGWRRRLAVRPFDADSDNWDATRWTTVPSGARWAPLRYILLPVVLAFDSPSLPSVSDASTYRSELSVIPRSLTLSLLNVTYISRLSLSPLNISYLSLSSQFQSLCISLIDIWILLSPSCTISIAPSLRHVSRLHVCFFVSFYIFHTLYRYACLPDIIVKTAGFLLPV